MKEKWKRVKGSPNYSVSDQGRVLNMDTSRILRATPSEGYPQVQLYKDGKPSGRMVHKLVIETFVGPCPLGYEVNHKDGIKSHCWLDNLEYLTSSENHYHAYRIGLAKGLCGEDNPNSKLNWGKVDLMREILQKGGQTRDVAKYFRVSKQTVVDIEHNRAWKK